MEEMPEFMNGVFMVQQTNDPRKETFLQMLKNTFCPNLTIMSFITIVTILDTLTFITTFVGSVAEHQINNTYFLGISPQIL